MKFIGINHSSTMIAEEMRNAISFRFRFMSTPRNRADEEIALLLVGLRMGIKNMIAKIGFTLVFFRAVRTEEGSFMCFHVIMHSALKSFCFSADGADKMTGFIFKIFIHCGGFYSSREKTQFNFIRRSLSIKENE